jgi:hypothetical protein
VYATENLIIAFGYEGKLATSTNGISWTQRASSFAFDTINGIVANPSRTQYVAVGDSGKIATSPNGTVWTQVFPSPSFGSSRIVSVASNIDSYVAVGTTGKVATSVGGLNWKQRVSNFGLDNINDVLLEESFALIVGNSGKIAYSV